MNYAFDFGGTSIKGIKFDDNNKELRSYHLVYEQRAENGLNVEFKYALNLVKKILIEENEESFGLAFSFPGVINPKGKKILSESAFINVNVDIEDFFSEVKGVRKIAIQNDGKAALLGEINFSNRVDANEDTLFLTIGTAVGGAAYINGELLAGSNWFAGEYTRMFVDIASIDNQEQTALYCGTMQACYRYAKAANKKLSEVDGYYLTKKFEEQDPIALSIFDNWTTSLAKLIANVNLVLDVKNIIIGGGISNYKPFVKILNTKMKMLGNKLHLPVPEIFSSTLNNSAGCYGALYNLIKMEGQYA
jgi:predicted NBD/HSP70 family sugar kinase